MQFDCFPALVLLRHPVLSVYLHMQMRELILVLMQFQQMSKVHFFLVCVFFFLKLSEGVFRK